MSSQVHTVEWGALRYTVKICPISSEFPACITKEQLIKHKAVLS
jgi:hypothetical protein